MEKYAKQHNILKNGKVPNSNPPKYAIGIRTMVQVSAILHISLLGLVKWIVSSEIFNKWVFLTL
jgi:hypothetical protein